VVKVALIRTWFILLFTKNLQAIVFNLVSTTNFIFINKKQPSILQQTTAAAAYYCYIFYYCDLLWKFFFFYYVLLYCSFALFLSYLPIVIFIKALVFLNVFIKQKFRFLGIQITSIQLPEFIQYRPLVRNFDDINFQSFILVFSYL